MYQECTLGHCIVIMEALPHVVQATLVRQDSAAAAPMQHTALSLGAVHLALGPQLQAPPVFLLVLPPVFLLVLLQLPLLQPPLLLVGFMVATQMKGTLAQLFAIMLVRSQES